MLLLVQDKSPNEVPFLDGMTYAPIPYLLLPRFLAPDKGLSHAGNILLSVNYGLQDIEGTRSTSIGWNLVAEAYANFGYAGVLAIAVFMGLLYGTVSRLTAGVPLTSFRFVSGLIVLAGVTNDNSLGVFLTMQFQGVVGVALASVFLMRRQPNPFAEEQASGGLRQEAGGKWGAPKGRGGGLLVAGNGRQGTKDSWVERGMPAPGVLTNLIEGAPVERAQQGARSEEHGAGNAVTAPRDVGTGGTVRSLPIRTPKRIASWMPRRVRAAVVAQYAEEEEGDQGTGGGGQGTAADVQTANGIRQEERQRPRQLAVPYQNYRRYRG
jgi:hypothetical protein